MSGSAIAGPDLSLITVKGLIGLLRQEIEVAPTWAPEVGLVVPSNQDTETYRWLSQTPQFRQWIGSRVLKGLKVNSYQLQNQLYEASLEFAKADWRRDKLGAIAMRVADLGVRSQEHWEKLVSALIEANGTCYDGVAFFASTHPYVDANGAAQTLSNVLTSSEVPALNVASATTPTVAEMVDVILGLIQHFMTFKDDIGEPINGNAKAFTVMVPVNMYGASIGAVNDAFIEAGRSNTIQSTDFAIKVKANPRLTSTSVMYMFRTDRMAKPFLLQTEPDATEVNFIGPGSEQAILNGRYIFGIEHSRAAGYGLWQYALKATLS